MRLNIQLVSDLHFEHQGDQGKEFTKSLPRLGADLIVLAGDISNAIGIQSALRLLAAHFAPTPVVFVCGNHEFYCGDQETTHREIDRAVHAATNLYWLNHSIITIHGRRILGTPLWFSKAALRKGECLTNDATWISDFFDWFFVENRRAIEFLEKNLREDDIVVSHYLPAPECIAPEYLGSPLNPFFLCDVKPLILDRKPAAWFHGHTHRRIDLMVGKTRIMANPFGYLGLERTGFDENLIVEV